MADTDTDVSILTGADRQFYYDPGRDTWYVVYGLPGSQRRLMFEASAEQMETIFGNNLPSHQEGHFDSLLADSKITFGGSIVEVMGEGSFEDQVQTVITLALDEGRLPEWMSQDNDAALALLFIAETEGKSDDWLIDQLSKLPAFKKRFWGIEYLLPDVNGDMSDAVTAYLEYEGQLREMAEDFLQTSFSDQAFRPLMHDLLQGGWNIEEVADTFDVFDRMQDNAAALDAFNEVLVQQGLEPLTTANAFAFMRGNAPQEIYDIYEASSWLEAAHTAGISGLFTAEDAMEAALHTPGFTSLEQSLQGMREAADALLRLRADIDLGRFGLTAEDLIDIKLGMPLSSGNDEAEVRRSIQAALDAAQDFLTGARSTPYRSFTGAGTPQAQSLAGSRPMT